MKRIFYTLIFGLLTLSSCDSYLDVNKDPNAVTSLDPAQLLTAVEYESAQVYTEGNYIGASLPSYTHHLTIKEVDNYSLTANYSTLGNTWNQAYVYALKNADNLIKVSDEADNQIYAGIGRFYKALVFTTMVDLFGDIPYSEFNINGITTPKVDPGADIYNAALVLLDEAKANFTNTAAANALTPGSNDVIYGGSTTKWVKATNTLKLKLLTQTRKAKTAITNWQTQLTSLLSENNFIADGEDFEFPHTGTLSPLDERNPGYVGEYEGGQKGMYISPWMYEILNGFTYNVKNNPFVNIKDPRIPYYFVNQVSSTDGLNNPSDYRDGAFVSIYPCSNSGFQSGNFEKFMSVIGIYPVGGKYDDDSAPTIGTGVGTGIAPDKIVEAYSVPFMKAELVLAGETTGDARALLQEAIEASIYHVNKVSQAAKGSDNVPVITKTTASVTTFVTAVLAKYDVASAAGKMEIVMTQKWISNFFNTIEAYNDIRRTGYPVLPTFTSGVDAVSPYAHTEAATPGNTPIPMKTMLAYPRVMYYADSEVSSNPNVTNVGRDVSAHGNVFWDVQ